MDITLSTELDAVNVLLSTIGEMPVNNLTAASTSDVAVARQILAEQNREVQSEGWSFNTDEDFDLVRDGGGAITLAPNVLTVVLRRTTDPDPVIRGQRLYDRKNKTYTFTKDVRVERIVYLLPFTDMPQSGRWYVTLRSARIFQDRVQGSDSRHAYTMQDELNAKRLLQQDSGRRDHLNMLDAPGVADILRRRPTRWH